MARNTDRRKLSLFDPLVDGRSDSDGEAPDDEEAPGEDSTDEGRRPDAVPYFRHR